MTLTSYTESSLLKTQSCYFLNMGSVSYSLAGIMATALILNFSCLGSKTVGHSKWGDSRLGWVGRGVCPGLYQFTRVDCAKIVRLEPCMADNCSVGRLRQGSVSKEKKIKEIIVSVAGIRPQSRNIHSTESKR